MADEDRQAMSKDSPTEYDDLAGRIGNLEVVCAQAGPGTFMLGCDEMAIIFRPKTPHTLRVGELPYSPCKPEDPQIAILRSDPRLQLGLESQKAILRCDPRGRIFGESKTRLGSGMEEAPPTPD